MAYAETWRTIRPAFGPEYGAGGETGYEAGHGRSRAPGHDQASAMSACSSAGAPRGRLLDWIDSQQRVTRIWLDQLIAEGDPGDLVSLIHRQAAWLDLMRSRLGD